MLLGARAFRAFLRGEVGIVVAGIGGLIGGNFLAAGFGGVLRGRFVAPFVLESVVRLVEGIGARKITATTPHEGRSELVAGGRGFGFFRTRVKFFQRRECLLFLAVRPVILYSEHLAEV